MPTAHLEGLKAVRDSVAGLSPNAFGSVDSKGRAVRLLDAAIADRERLYGDAVNLKAQVDELKLKVVNARSARWEDFRGKERQELYDQAVKNTLAGHHGGWPEEAAVLRADRDRWCESYAKSEQERREAVAEVVADAEPRAIGPVELNGFSDLLAAVEELELDPAAVVEVAEEVEFPEHHTIRRSLVIWGPES